MSTLQTPALTLVINIGTTTDGNALAASLTDISPLTAACEIQGAQKLLNLYFQQKGVNTGDAPVNLQLPSGFALAFNGKATANLGANTVLFTASNFAEMQSGGLFYYQAFLDLNKTEIATAFAAEDGDLLACTADIDLDLPATAGVPALQAVYQLGLNLKRQAYAGTESAPTPATPTYPAAGAVQTAVAAVTPYQITATGGAVTIPAGTRAVNLSATLTSELLLTLPAGAPYAAGTLLVISLSGNVNGHTVSLFAAAGGDSLNTLQAGDGGPAIFDPTTPAGTRVVVESSGGGDWQTVPQGAGAAFILLHYTSNASKLADSGDPGQPAVQPGYPACIDGEGGRIEQYLGPLAGEAGAGCSVNGSAYAPDGGGGYLQVNIPDNTISGTPGNWQWNVNGQGNVAGSNGSWPWSHPWTLAAGQTGTAPIVTRNDVASDANWLVHHNTVNLLITYHGSVNLTVAGVVCPGSTVTAVGWVFPDSIPSAITGATQCYINQIDWNGGNNAWIGSMYFGAGGFACPVPLSPRQTVRFNVN